MNKKHIPGCDCFQCISAQADNVIVATSASIALHSAVNLKPTISQEILSRLSDAQLQQFIHAARLCVDIAERSMVSKTKIKQQHLDRVA